MDKITRSHYASSYGGGAFFFQYRKSVRLKHPKGKIINVATKYFLNLLLAGKYETLNKQNKTEHKRATGVRLYFAAN